jgi:poly-beta-1,6-N-acetyl-D-glucosamine synthesis protein
MTNTDIRLFMLLIFFIWAIFYSGLWSWKNYNLKRFGALNRRLPPEYTSTEELLNLELMSKEDFHLLHHSRVVVFEKNPIKDIRK